MKKIIYTRFDGGLSVANPVEGARLAFSITVLENGRVRKLWAGGNTGGVPLAALPVDTILRGWPVEGASAEWAETEDQFLTRVLAKVVPDDAVNVRICDAAEIPTDRTFRNAWEDGDGGIKVNMLKARELHKARLRELRKPLLVALDVAYMQADEIGDIRVKVEIAVKKQALRDVTADSRIEAAQTPEELKAVLPEAFKI